MFKTDALGLEAVIEMFERDLPGWTWGVGRCPCGNPDGDYSARVTSPDYQQPMMALNLATGQMAPVQGSGHDIGAHGQTPAQALSRVYGHALEKVA
jgi:hypothetical protein